MAVLRSLSPLFFPFSTMKTLRFPDPPFPMSVCDDVMSFMADYLTAGAEYDRRKEARGIL